MTPRRFLRLLSWTPLAFTSAFASVAYAAAVLQSAKGDVRAGAGSVLPQPVEQNARLLSGTRVTTGAGAQAILRFDDGQHVILSQNTDFRIVDYRYSEGGSGNDRSVLDMLRGALRVMTGQIGQRNAAAFALRLPQGTINIRGTDFMVAIVNPAFMGVLDGAIGFNTDLGTVAFGTGIYGSVASKTALPVSIPVSALPAEVASAFGNLSAVTQTAAGGAATGATAAEAGAVPAKGGSGAALGAAAAAALLLGGGGGGTTTNH